MARVTARDRLLLELDCQAYAAARKAAALREDPALCAYASLFDHAARFWRDVKDLAANDWPMGPDHRAALKWAAGRKTP